jgi:hypothetical protein
VFEIPADIPALDDEKLSEALDAALTEAAEFDSIPDAELTDEHLERLSALADFTTAAKNVQSERGAAASARTERIAAARAALTRPEAPAEEPAAEEPAEPVKEVVAASAATPAKVAVLGRTTTSKEVAAEITPSRPMLTASADVPGFTTGGELADLTAVSQAMLARMKALPTQRLGGARGVQNRYSVANINLGQVRSGDLRQDAPGVNDQGLIQRAANVRRLEGGSLTAAGGWCAPSETLYDLCQTASTDGLLDLPTVTVTRGGIRYTRGPSFDDLYNDPDLGWWLTEAEIIAQDGTEDPPLKPCVTVPCPDFEEVRLDAIGLCIKVGLLTQAAYPELVQWTIENALIAHQHKVDTALIQKIVDGSTQLDVSNNAETAIDALGVIEQAANYIRQSYRLSFTSDLEMLLPIWYRTVLRADLARRTGVDLINVSDAQLASYFTARNIRVQWLYNYQPLQGVPVDTPDTVQAVIYPAGAWIKGTTDIINLDAVYDSTNLAVNTYTALFTEEGVLVAPQCFDSYLLDLPTCASGRTGAADITSCLLETGTVIP